MIILGDNLVPYENIVKISNIDEIKTTPSNSIVMFYYDEKILKYCYENSVPTIVIVSSIKESIYANSLKALYIVCEKNIASKIQKIADNYMFDSKITAIIKTNDEFEEIATLQIDAVIYESLLA